MQCQKDEEKILTDLSKWAAKVAENNEPLYAKNVIFLPNESIKMIPASKLKKYVFLHIYISTRKQGRVEIAGDLSERRRRLVTIN